ncbi:OB-fold nucleic acid binding protein, partial [Aspergillus sp. HF37]
MAPAAKEEDLVFYPAFCFKASPTHFTWVKLAGVDVHQLKRRKEFEAQGTFFYLNHPIRFVCLVGIIVARTEAARCTILTLDDSSGATVDVVVSKPPPPPPLQQPQTHNDTGTGGRTHQSATSKTPLDITALLPGAMTKIKGTLSTYRSTTQIHLERHFAVPDTNAEMRFLEQRVRFLVEVLAGPWVLADVEVEALREDADREEVRVDEERRGAERRRRRR